MVVINLRRWTSSKLLKHFAKLLNYHGTLCYRWINILPQEKQTKLKKIVAFLTIFCFYIYLTVHI
jgi:hypothetical protein